MAISTILGYPRIGRCRELKTALESYWKGKIPESELLKTAGGLREAPGVVALDLREADLVGVFLLQRRHLAEGGSDGEAGGGSDRANKRLSAIDEHCVSSLRRTLRVVAAH